MSTELTEESLRAMMLPLSAKTEWVSLASFDYVVDFANHIRCAKGLDMLDEGQAIARLAYVQLGGLWQIRQADGCDTTITSIAARPSGFTRPWRWKRYMAHRRRKGLENDDALMQGNILPTLLRP